MQNSSSIDEESAICLHKSTNRWMSVAMLNPIGGIWKCIFILSDEEYRFFLVNSMNSNHDEILLGMPFISEGFYKSAKQNVNSHFLYDFILKIDDNRKFTLEENASTKNISPEWLWNHFNSITFDKKINPAKLEIILITKEFVARERRSGASERRSGGQKRSSRIEDE